MIGVVRLIGPPGADEANVGTDRFVRHSDGAFYVSEEAAAQLCSDGRSGFRRARRGKCEPIPGTVSVEEIEAMIDGLSNGELRSRLLDASNESRVSGA